MPSRRDLLRTAGVGAGAALLAPLQAEAQQQARGPAAPPPSFEPFNATSPLPHRGAFFERQGAYLDAGGQHPMSKGARAAIGEYQTYKAFATQGDYSIDKIKGEVLAAYAKLINCDAADVSFVPSTTAGENLILSALGYPREKARIVTDSLHFFGSFMTYGELARQGVDVVTLQPQDRMSIPVSAFEAAITPGTKLVAISSVSTYNGFEHDLAAICKAAHAKGAMVYADCIHSVGAVPFDVKATGVDFASASSYKWLMGDMGLGFLYVRPDRRAALQRPWVGYHQAASFASHVYPGDPPGDGAATFSFLDTTVGKFECGTVNNLVAAQLSHSLPYINTVGVTRIQDWRQPLMDAIRERVTGLGYECLTPKGTRTPLITFHCENAREKVGAKLREKGVTLSVSRHRFRASVSVFNTMGDVEALASALPKA